MSEDENDWYEQVGDINDASVKFKNSNFTVKMCSI